MPSSDEGERERPTRRKLLATIGVGTVSTGLAGCTGLLSEPESDGDGGAATDAPTATDSAAETATEAQTEAQDTQAQVSGPTAGLEPCLRPASAATCGSPVSVGGDISADTVWGAECDEYVVADSVSVTGGATLTVEPGTRVVFAQNTALHVEEDSALSAVGTCGDPIVFTGEQQTRGYWDGIQLIEADQTPSELAYCVVEYGGGDRFTWAPAAGNVAVVDGARTSITNSVVRESAGYGVVLDSNVIVDGFSENVLTANESGAAFASARAAGGLSDTSSYTGNDEDVVVLYGGTITEGQEPTWDGIDVPYRVVAGDDVTVRGHLTVAPGATIEFGQDCAMTMDDSGPGRLTAVGIDPDTEESRPITFTGEQKTRGYWQGIQFYESDRTENQLRNCVVEYAGSERFTWANAAANVVAIDGSRVRIDDTVIRESAAYGVQIDGESEADSFTRNTLTRNGSGAAYVHPRSAAALSDTGTYAGNDVDTVAVYGGTITENQRLTWDAIDVPYTVRSGDAVTVRGHLTVAPGTTVEFGQDSSLTMDDSGPGRLTAVGIDPDTEESRPITFTGEQKTPGYWKGIQFYESNRTENRLRNCVVEYGGGDRFTWAQEPANVVVIDGSRLALVGSTIRHSAGYAVDVDGESTLTASNNTYTNNASGGVSN
ncbi:right-handed parallel beta-helix repeat-containing protein [Haloarcula marina]|uniref:right-handed parallel beta-helix repeat-containing protein n=1 Tax=Haloarcula marina TaxID=2961574 RepID=UPI0020B679A6|nr:right-handed parallel beta-helix repeat-containing protein [Halomicroarcula marina]